MILKTPTPADLIYYESIIIKVFSYLHSLSHPSFLCFSYRFVLIRVFYFLCFATWKSFKGRTEYFFFFFQKSRADVPTLRRPSHVTSSGPVYRSQKKDYYRKREIRTEEGWDHSIRLVDLLLYRKERKRIPGIEGPKNQQPRPSDKTRREKG